MDEFSAQGADPRGLMTRQGNVWRVRNALVEESFFDGRESGYLVVSYAEPGQHGMVHIELLRLNVGPRTTVINQFGRPVCLCIIQPGMWVDADFSPAMTRSIPPQTTAFRIMVRQSAPEPGPQPGPVAAETVVSVDAQNGLLLTGHPHDMNRQIRFVVTRDTQILDRHGHSIPLSALQTGQRVRVTHADFMTMSIPPQTTAFRIQVM
ncbi:hypothetical protein SDC9_116046 [bioreactor metagenome]|uniref:Uncharacterized protein n=1 Tax=bioreactor metagenome TaxID=1076179 RepID=A0A645BV19_9ZZZZ